MTFFEDPITFRPTKEIKAMIKKLVETDVEGKFEESESMVIRAAIIHFYNHIFNREIKELKE